MDQSKKTLLNTFWCSKGWRFSHPTPEAYRQALEEGYFFPEREILPHDEAMSVMHSLLDQISAQDVADAFLYSLSTRKLEYRSALGSYWFARAIPNHVPTCTGSCIHCGWSEVRIRRATARFPAYTDESFMNFERYKWGGVRHTELNYILLDLSEFLKLPRAVPTQHDRDLLRAILAAINELPPSKKAGAFRDLLSKKKIIPSNKQEIGNMLDILGICGILSSDAHPCACVKFQGSDGLPPREHTNDFKYPVTYWHAWDGVNEERFLKVFNFEYSDL